MRIQRFSPGEERAKERQGTRTDKNIPEKLPESSKGDARDKAAERTREWAYSRAKKTHGGDRKSSGNNYHLKTSAQQLAEQLMLPMVNA